MTRAVLLAAVFLAAVFGAVGVALPAQQVQDAQPPMFSAHSDLVVLHVNVFDSRSDAVPQLPRDAFRVVEDGVLQDITFFEDSDVPVAVGLVVDNSSSMLTRRNMVVTGTRAFAESSHDEDEVFAIVFNEHVRFGLPDGVRFTTSRWQIEAGLRRYTAGGMTAIHDAVIAGLDHLDLASHQKKVLVVLSDGKDNASRRSEAEMFTRVERSDALVYAISTADFSAGGGNNGLLKKLAARSGGVAYFPESEAAVVKAFSEVAGNIRRGYRIGYTPTNTRHDGSFRRVDVSVDVPGRKKLSVRGRDGYVADVD